jgi:hypothetical protein
MLLLMKWLAYSLADQPIETTITIMMTHLQGESQRVSLSSFGSLSAINVHQRSRIIFG